MTEPTYEEAVKLVSPYVAEYGEDAEKFQDSPCTNMWDESIEATRYAVLQTRLLFSMAEAATAICLVAALFGEDQEKVDADARRAAGLLGDDEP